MHEIDDPKGAQVPDAQGDSKKPPRRRPLDTLERVRREMTVTYWEHREGRIGLDDAKGRVHILGKISEVLKAEHGSDDEIAGLLKQVREKLKGDR
ncbi:hypothetical protein [Roseateles asaccharophilus]|uniref:Uncharacterized protein n=1 Tax=Roseateles asaccharophilus TaxID=582607 RepID=A0ABU2A4R7_9BURK|nr:hypothetical protein [Roseateles asaccharophilus]MDR7332000.1 hypothetical protein [Roseateles asaccharophilus]